MENNLSIVILAAGKGSRMKSDTPKVLHEIANKSMLLHVIDNSKKLKPKNIYVVLGKKSDDVKNTLPKNIKVIIQDEQLGTGHALLCAKNILTKAKGKLLVLYGDVPLVESKTLKKLIKKDAKNISMLGFNTSSPKGYGRIKVKNYKVSEVIEEKNLMGKDSKIKTCYSGIFCGNTKLIFSLLTDIKKSKSHNEYLLTDIFILACKKNISISLSITTESEVMGVNNLYQLSLAEEYFQNKLRKNFLLNGVLFKDPKTVYFSFDTKIGAKSKIDINNNFGKNVIIKSNVLIKSNNDIESSTISEGANIGPFSRLRNNAIIGKNAKIGNFVEIKNSTIGNNTKVNHLTYIGDSIIGSNTNIGAGTITCNFDGKNKNRTLIGDNVFIGSNCALIAPIKIGSKSFVAAGSTISDNLNTDDFSIARAKQKIIKAGSKRFLKRRK